MNADQREHLELLRQRPCCLSEGYLQGYYGLPHQGEWKTFFRRWAGTLKGGDRCGERADRTLLETFFQQKKMVPRKWMAAFLGMDEMSLCEVLARREEMVLPTVYEYFGGALVLEAFKDDLLGTLRSLRFRTFGNHSDFCRRLHAALAEEYKIKVEALYCDTSKELGDKPLLYAHYFDCVTLQTVSIKHSMWLNFGKPLSLPPDRCSKLFFARNRAELEFALAGMGSISGMEQYETVASHGG